MTIKAIETFYRGYRFRSRLEARWAVFFEECNLDFQYEPEGLEITLTHRRIKYLPDFWLEYGHWAEVKGFLDLSAMLRLYEIAGALTGCDDGNDLVIFGNIPKRFSIKWPVQLHRHGRYLYGAAWDPYVDECPAQRPHVTIEPTLEMAAHLTDGFPVGRPDWAVDGLERARQARFEWGERG